MLKKRIKFLFSREAFKSLRTHFLQALGVLWLFVEAASYFFPGMPEMRNQIFYGFLVVAVLWTIARSFPPLNYSKRSRPSNVEIEIKIGNLFEQPGNIAFGCSDCFDTEPERVIGSKSLMAQIVNNSFGGDHTLLDSKISQSLKAQVHTGKPDPNKTFGKSIRFAIGTVAVVPVRDRKVFMVAFSVTNDDKTTTTTKEDLWASLCHLWTAVRQHGFLEPIAVPVLGAGLARFPASRTSLIQLLLLSYAIATREALVSRKLTLVISENSYHPEEITEAVELLNTLEF